jgi:hypothetical protein
LGSPFTCCSDNGRPSSIKRFCHPKQQIDVERTKLARFFATVDEYQILQPRAAVARIASLIRARGMYPRDAFRAFNFRYMHEVPLFLHACANAHNADTVLLVTSCGALSIRD